MPAGFVERLESELKDRLRDLESEAAVIRRALTALEDERDRPQARPRSARVDDQALLEELQRAPGARASVIALTRGWPADLVSSRLKRLEAAAAVEREGLGWRLR